MLGGSTSDEKQILHCVQDDNVIERCVEFDPRCSQCQSPHAACLVAMHAWSAAPDMPSGRMLFFIGRNRNPTLAETDDLSGANFAGLAQFNLTVDAHFAPATKTCPAPPLAHSPTSFRS